MRLKERWVNACAAAAIASSVGVIPAYSADTNDGLKALLDTQNLVRHMKGNIAAARNPEALWNMAMMPSVPPLSGKASFTILRVRHVDINGEPIITPAPALPDQIDPATQRAGDHHPDIVAHRGSPLDLVKVLNEEKTPSLKTYFAGCGDNVMPYERFYAEHIKTDKMHTLVADTLYNTGRILYPFAYTGAEVTKKSDISALQMLLVRMNAYPDQSRSHIDGQMGELTHEAIKKCQTALAKKYADIKTDGNPDPVFLKALANEGAKDIFYREHLIRTANMHNGRLNQLSYRIALAHEIEGHYLGNANPNYVVLDSRKAEQEIDIIARTMYGEARGESIRGQQAVAETLAVRFIKAQLFGGGVRRLFGGKSLADVAKHKTRKTWGYQFDTWNPKDGNYDDIMKVTKDNPIFKSSLYVAEKAFWGELPQITNGADHYHATYVSPKWKNAKKLTEHIGAHKFYRLYGIPKSYEQATKLAQIIADVRVRQITPPARSIATQRHP